MSKFLKYVEITTKITSVTPFLLTLAFLIYLKIHIDPWLTFVYFIGMLLFDMTATAINNYIDSKSNGQEFGFNRRLMLNIIIGLFAASTLCGGYLALKTDAVVLLTGIMCFVAGTLYTAGPVPISRGPLGEAISGAFYGIAIPFILMYINMPKDTFIRLGFTLERVDVSLYTGGLFMLLLFAAAPGLATANVMLANNICDMKRDVSVGRHTLAYYLGDKALILFRLNYVFCYVSFGFLIALGYFPLISALSLLTLPIVSKKARLFCQNPVKEITFIYSVQSFILVVAPNIVLLTVGAFL